VVPDDYAADRIATIGVAYDATEEAKLALEHACRLADRLDAGLLILTVAEPVVFPAAVPDLSRTHVEKSTHRWLEQQLDKAVKESPVPAEGRMLKGEAPHALAEAIDDGLDMLVLGSRGYGPVRSVLLGSTSRALVDRLQCPVMVVPRAATG
jgi:nucleotide-binding universal stress UspA family protein